MIDGVSVPVVRVSATELAFVVPANVACDAALTVSNLDLQAANAVFNPSPTLTSIVTPNGTSAAGGSFLLLLGSGFVAGTTVTVGGNPATITSTSAGGLVGTLPAGNVGPAAVVITTPTGCSVSGSLTYTP